ncbi:MAG: hypothetical protein GY913_28540 [Proteobacteria bacterium]|nr:hypothetical protein [Pseudomonadota bacterium]MCP4920861.1 hypothetical protein [Pseudomonadota bacterium]
MLALALTASVFAVEREVIGTIVLLPGVELESAELELTADMDTTTLVFVDDGKPRSDVREDGTWTAEGDLEWARWTRSALYVTVPDGERQLVYSDFEQTDAEGPLRFGYRLQHKGELMARRSVSAWPGGGVPIRTESLASFSFAWGAIAVVYVGFVVTRRRE